MTSPDRAPLRADLLQELLVGPDRPLRRLVVLQESTSTNTELAAAVRADPDAWPAPSLVLTEHQLAGRGRSGRAWQTPPRAAILASVLQRPGVPAATMTWLPLIAGLATVHALRATANVDAVLKWPNDVLVPAPPAEDGTRTEAEGWGPLRKLGGILVEVLPDGGAIVGVGINVSQTADELPVPSATSLLLVGTATTDREVLLTALHEAFAEIMARWRAADGDAVAAGLAGEVAEVCATIGARVGVDLVDGTRVVGVATGLGPGGELLLTDDAGAARTIVSGDVQHLRAVVA